MLATHLSPSSAPSWKSHPQLLSKPCRTTSALVGKSYMAAGQAVSRFMPFFQAYQVDVLKEMDKSGGLTPEAVKELRRATNLALRATKNTAHVVGRTMAGFVAVERNLWLNLNEICEKRRSSYWTPLSPSQVCLERWSTQWLTNSELLRPNRLPLGSLCLGGLVNLPLLPPRPGNNSRTR